MRGRYRRDPIGASRLAAFVGAVACGLVCGCSGLDAPAAGLGPAACGHGVVANEWRMRWHAVNHRVSLLGFEPDPDGGCADLPGATRVAIKGGDWSTGESFVDALAVSGVVSSLDAGAPTPAVGFARSVADFVVGPQADSGDGIGRATTELDFDLEALSMAGTADVVAVLAGWSIDTDVVQGPGYPSDYSPAHGYTPMRFDFAVGAPLLEDGGRRARVPVSAELAWGPSDRDDMNVALLEARVAVRVHVLLIALDVGVVVPWQAGYALSYPDPSDGPSKQPHATYGQRYTVVEGLAGFDTFVPAWTRVRHDLGDTSAGAVRHGYYLRELHDRLGVFEDVDANGRMVLDVDGYVSTTSLLDFHQLFHRFEATGVVIGLPAAVGHSAVGYTEADHAVGAVTYPHAAAGQPASP